MTSTKMYAGQFQVRAWHDCSYIAGIPLLAHGLTVKLSPCQCSDSSPARRIAACLCGHPKCNLLPCILSMLLLAQARPRMIQHLSSNKETEHECVEQPYLDSMYQACLGFPKPLFQPFDVQVPGLPSFMTGI